jgi:hypothetical protein
MATFTVEHWRDDELIAKFKVSKLKREGENLTIRIPRATITLNTDDELSFSLKELIRFLEG